MKLLFATLILFTSYINLSSQVLKGTIKDSSGEPLAYATVYIQELQQGTTTNTKGNYELRLPEGKYTVIYQNLGYAPDIRDITIGKTTVIKDITLQVQYFEIPEVRITATGEDPAYEIMRRAIGLAPYHLNQVIHYKAEVYLKGNLIIKRIPKLMQKAIKVEARNEAGNSVNSSQIKEGDSYLMESVNELEFNAPDKYTQRVLSYQNTFPDQGNQISPMDFIEASFYQPELAITISPLSPDAFFHYNFKYMGASPQGNFIVDKIQVIPKRKSQQLFSGTIFIIEDLWCLHSVDLINENIAGKIKVQQVFIPVKDDIWLPVSHKFEINIGIIGFKADAGYGSSIKYLEVDPNTNLKKPESRYPGSGKNVTAENRMGDTTVTKTRKQIDKILSKDELTNRDMVKLSGLMEKESKSSLKDTSKNTLEIKDNVKHIIEKDATKKDSLYWAEKRPIPLSEAENRSLRVADSIKAKLVVKDTKNDTIAGKKEEKKKFLRTLKEITSGHTYSDTLGFSFTNEGLIKLKNLNFNPVDGFVYGADFRMTKTWRKSGTSFSFNPSFNWAFSRNQPIWSVNLQYRFDRKYQKQIYLVTGVTSKDFNYNGGLTPFLNTVTSLFMKRNWLKLYESRYLTLGYRTEISNGLNANIFSTLEDRSILSNTTDFSFFRKAGQYTENVPDNPFLKNPPIGSNPLISQRHAEIGASITYIPRQKYRLFRDRKLPMGSDWPTFTLGWKHGINEIPGTGPGLKHYDMIKFEVFKSDEIGVFGEYYWTIRAGGFLNNKDVPFYDYFHFNSQPLFFSLKTHRNAFMLPGFYSLSTPEYFIEAHGRYTAPYMILKLLPVLSNTLMRENVSLSVLYSHYQKCYTEIGYSVSEILLLGEIGVYAGFDNFSYKSFGVKVVLKFN